MLQGLLQATTQMPIYHVRSYRTSQDQRFLEFLSGGIVERVLRGYNRRIRRFLKNRRLSQRTDAQYLEELDYSIYISSRETFLSETSELDTSLARALASVRRRFAPSS